MGPRASADPGGVGVRLILASKGPCRRPLWVLAKTLASVPAGSVNSSAPEWVLSSKCPDGAKAERTVRSPETLLSSRWSRRPA